MTYCAPSLRGESFTAIRGIHPVLQEPSATRPNVAVGVKQPFFGMNEGFRLAERRHIQVREGIAQMLLRQGGTDAADGRRLAPLRACPSRRFGHAAARHGRWRS